jgi:hypothetical protein
VGPFPASFACLPPTTIWQLAKHKPGFEEEAHYARKTTTADSSQEAICANAVSRARSHATRNVRHAAFATQDAPIGQAEQIEHMKAIETINQVKLIKPMKPIRTRPIEQLKPINLI